jgi:hypothetical protein
MLMLLAALLTVLCAKIVARPFEHRDSPATLTGLTVAGIIASYTHHFGFLLAFAAGSVRAVAAETSRGRAPAKESRLPPMATNRAISWPLGPVDGGPSS